MPTTDPRIDAYIEKSAEFARPILRRLRQLVHKGCPKVEETIKWGMPFFTSDGDLLANMAAFKQHCAFGFWKAPAMKDAKRLLGERAEGEGAMGHLGRITSEKDLPGDKVMLAWIKEAAALNAQGVKVAHRAPKEKKAAPLKIPPYFTQALAKVPEAKAHFAKMPPSHRREYVTWITEAKTDATREKRLATAVEWIAEGKSRMWKYEKKR